MYRVPDDCVLLDAVESNLSVCSVTCLFNMNVPHEDMNEDIC